MNNTPLESSLSAEAPWSGYYVSLPEYIGDLTAKTLYGAYVHANRDNTDALAICSMDGRLRYTHGELKEMTDLAAGGFWKMGIRKGSKVGLILNNTVEEAVSLLALNKLGATAVFIDASKALSDISHAIAGYGLALLMIDEAMLAMEPVINPGRIPLVIVSQTKPAPSSVSMIDLYRMGVGVDIPPAPYERGRPSVIINSSGTTGFPKPIVHTDHSVNMAAYKVLRTDYSLTRANLTMKVIPSYIGLGLITTLYTALLSGTKIALIPCGSIPQGIRNTITFASSFPKLRDDIGLDQNAKLIVFAAPMFFRALCEKLELFEDMSHMGAMLAAGSRMGKEELERINSKLAERHCPVKICNGYGQNEMCGAVTLNSNCANKPGSAGFPVIGTDICIVDPETFARLGRNEPGLILEKSDSLFEYYYDLPQESREAIVELDDGTRWFNTKDLGLMDEDGFLFVTGRITRVLVRYDMKLSIDKIENKIKQHPAVQECAVIAVPDGTGSEVPIAYITTTQEVNELDAAQILEEIQRSSDPLAELEIPVSMKKCDELPLLESGKIDYRALQARSA